MELFSSTNSNHTEKPVARQLTSVLLFSAIHPVSPAGHLPFLHSTVICSNSNDFLGVLRAKPACSWRGLRVSMFKPSAHLGVNFTLVFQLLNLGALGWLGGSMFSFPSQVVY
jgi:hypothetical protein